LAGKGFEDVKMGYFIIGRSGTVFAGHLDIESLQGSIRWVKARNANMSDSKQTSLCRVAESVRITPTFTPGAL
jgi:hypothetical protein